MLRIVVLGQYTLLNIHGDSVFNRHFCLFKKWIENHGVFIYWCVPEECEGKMPEVKGIRLVNMNNRVIPPAMDLCNLYLPVDN